MEFRKLIIISSLILICTQFLSCFINPVSPERMLECHESVESSGEINAYLSGKWEWKSIKCDVKVKDGIKALYKDVEIEFPHKDTILIRFKGEFVGGYDRQAEIPFNWNQNNNPEWDSAYLFIGNSIQFCGNKLLFRYRPNDGCDNLFKRKNN